MSKKLSDRALRRKLQRDLGKDKIQHLSTTDILYQVKYLLNETQAQNLLKSLPKEKIEFFRGISLPRNYSEIRSTGKTYANDDLTKELSWYNFSFKEYYTEINTFIKLEDAFEHNFLIGNYTEARDVLNIIETTICHSFWTIEKKLLVAEYEFGFKKNKEILTNIVNKSNDNLTNVFAKQSSIKVEKNLSYFTYKEFMQQFLNLFNDKKLKEYFDYKLNFFSKTTYENKGFFLSIDDTCSIIDKYNSFVSVILLIVSEKEKNKELIIDIIKILTELSINIDDPRIVNILNILGKRTEFTITNENKEYINILDLYIEGRYNEVIIKLNFFLKDHSHYFELYELYNKSLINLKMEFENIFNLKSIAGKTLEDLYDIIIKNDKTQTSLVSGFKLLSSIGFNGWAYKFYSFFNIENSYIESKFDYNKLSSLNSKYYNPILSLYFENNIEATYFLDKIETQVASSSATIEFWKKISSALYNFTFEFNIPSININEFRQKLYTCKAMQAIGKFEEALQGYSQIQNYPKFIYENSIQHNKVDIIHGILFCLLNLSEFEKAVDLVSTNNILNPNLTHRLKYDFLINKIIKFDDENLMKNISSSIILHQYQNMISPNDLWISYDNFLSSQGLNYPKEIEKILGNIEKDKAVYFLRHICKQETYSSSYWFENQDDLDNERIEICSILTKLDKGNFEEYINEISEINRQILIRKGIKQIDESKIYVDIKGIKKSLENDVRESFERSKSISNLSLDQIHKLDLNSDSVYFAYYKKSVETNKVEFKDSDLKIASYSRISQFSDMFLKIRDKFIASNEFGIDTYLSMRIRHGTLLGEIRSVFEKYYLITKKGNSNKYEENEYWLKGNIGSNQRAKQSFDLIMSGFSENIDRISEELKNKKLQIKTEKKPSDGLFDYSYDGKSLQAIFLERMADIENYEIFFDEVIAVLWERTEINLSNIREEISNIIKDEIVDLLTNLLHKIEQLFNKQETPEVSELIRNITSCQTEIKNELDKIAEWFKRTNSKSINEFYINLPIDATLTTIKRLFKDFSQLEPEIINKCTIKFEGEHFPHFTYIMQNLFHNILEHSALPFDLLKVKIEILQDDNILTLIMENNFSDEINLITKNIQIESTRQVIINSHDNDKIRAEKGTGYLKINKTLKSDLARDEFLIKLFDVDENRIFKSMITFNIDGLKKN